MALIDVIKYEGDNSTFIWKHPCEDFTSMTQLIVHESQEALFFMNGQALDLFGAGRYTLETQNIPKLGNFLKRNSGDKTPFHCEVYFINQTVQMGMKWGTDSKIRYIDPESGLPLEIGAYGEMNLQVCDSRKLLLKLVGTMNGISWGESGNGFTKSIQSSFKPLISTQVKSNLTSSIKALNLNLLEIDEHLEELSLVLQKKLLPGFEEYGLTIPQFFILGILLPEENPNFRKIKELHTLNIQKKMYEAEAELRAASAKSKSDAQIAEVKAKQNTEIALKEAEEILRKASAKAEERASIEEANAMANITAAKRKIELENQATETEIAKREIERQKILAQAEAERKLIMAQADVEAARQAGFAQAQVMQAKGYNEKDLIQADIQKAFAQSIGNMGGSGGTAMGDLLSLGIGLKAAGTMGGQIGNMFSGFGFNQNSQAQFETPVNQTAPESKEAMKCPKCGAALSEKAKFCPECGEKIVRLAENEMVCPDCGNIVKKGSKFCPECGHKFIAVCPSCQAVVNPGSKFCPECGQKL